MTIEEIPSSEARYNGVGGFDIYVNGGFDVNDLEFEYSSTYVDDSWLASKGGLLDVNHGEDVARECSATTGWYSTMAEAKSHGLKTITKVRIKVKDGKALKPGQYIYAWLKHKVRSKTLDNTPLQNGDEIINYASIKDNEYYTSWYKPSYIPHAYPTPPEYWAGDRVTFSGGKVRIIKSVDRNSFEPGGIATFSLDSSYTNDTGANESSTVTIKDMLPKGLKYIVGSVKNANEPTIGTCADVADIGANCSSDNQVLIWNLGEKTANINIPDINYSAQVEATAPQGTLTNYAIIEAPSDASAPTQRRSDVNINITIPATINLSKSVLNQSPQETNGAPIEYEVSARNGSSVTVTKLDMIDILPFNGDSSINFRDITIPRNPATAFHGSRKFEEMELIAHPNSPGVCDLSPGIKYYYTKEDPQNINMSPKDTSNQDPGTSGSIWCEGTTAGPDAGCGFSKAEVTAIRAAGPSMGEDGVCQLKFKMSLQDNKPDDFYNNSAGASATGVTLPVVSNAATVVIVKSSLGNYVWFDANANGIQDSGEAGINDINVSLYKSDGTLVASTKTKDDDNGKTGYYKFDNLHSGDYYVKVTPPIGFEISPKNAGDDERDSDIDATGKSDIIHLGVAIEDLKYDAGIYKTSSIGDTIWYDTNKNGIQDSGEDCRDLNIKVQLLDSANNLVATKDTQNCQYLFDNLNQGSYKVKFTLPNGYEATLKGAGSDSGKDSDIDTSTLTSDTIILANGNDVRDVDFGYFSNTSIGNLVWEDKNANGIQDSGETGVDGIKVQLLDKNNNIIDTKTTANGGKYLFDNLVAGEYILKFTPSQDYKVSTKDTGDDDEKDSDVDANSFTTDTITLTQGKEDLSWDLGIYKEVSLGDTIWVDDNGNGIQDSGEDCDNLEATVTLIERNISQKTQNCKYEFKELKPGSYHLKFELPTGYTATTKDSTDDSKDSDIDNSGTTVSYTLTSGERKTDIDAGFLKDATLGDTIWLDENQNGIQDSGEKGIKDVTIELLKSDGSQTGKTVTTDANGHYKFSALKPASYKIKITLPNGFKLSNKDAGNDDTKDSDINPSTLESEAVTLHSGQEYKDLDGGLYSISSIGDRVWLDSNANGIQDDGEVGLKDVDVELLKADESPTGKTLKTDENGNYIFKNLTAGEYKVKFTLPSGYILSDKKQGDDDAKDSDVDSSLITEKITLALNTHITTIDMGVYKLGSIGDKIWIDSNNDGIQDSGESCSGVEMEVTLIDSKDRQTKQTTQNCSYKFSDLKPDSYRVKFTLPDGYTPAISNSGDDDTKDSDIDMNAITSEVILTSGIDRSDIDAGIVKDGSLGDRVWLDANKNGIQDDGEKGIADVVVKLLNEDGSESGKTTTTNKDGIYSFTSLKPAKYKVKIELPTGYKVTTKNSSDDEAKDSDLDASSLVSDTFTLLSGTAEPRVDIGLYTLSKLGDRVWLDSNANGIQDDGEIGVKDVKITLLDSSNNPLREPILTDSNGNYLFNSLPAGEYKIKVTLPEGYSITSKDSTNDDNKDSDIDENSLISDSVTITNSGENLSLDAGIYKKASVGDSIWLDANNNGIQDSDEDCNNQEIEVVLQDKNSKVVKTTKTKDCKYLFSGLKPDSYKIVFKLPSGLSVAKKGATDDKSKDSDINRDKTTDLFTLKSGENRSDIDAGFLQNATIGDKVWLDANTNGIQDNGEVGVKDIEVTLLDSTGNEIKKVKTNNKGVYNFTDLKPNRYAIKVKLPKGYVLSSKDAGDDDSKDSDIDEKTFTTTFTTLDSGEIDNSWDIGIYALTKLGDRVWLDRDADGKQDDNEEGIANISVTLLDKDGKPTGKTTKTDKDGKYLFADLKPASYKVGFTVPDGYQVSPQNIGDDNLDSDINIDTNSTDIVIMKSGESDMSIDLGLIALKSISGHVMIDINDDDKADKPLGSVEIVLNKCQDKFTTTTKSDENGFYKFEGLIPGCYKVTEIDPKGYTSVSDVDGENDNNITVNLKDKDITGRDFLDEPLLKVSGHVRADMDFDGDIEVESSKDINLKNVEISLYKGDEKIATTKTDEKGTYQFEDITPGDYIIKEVDLKGFDSLRDVDGENDNTIAIKVVESDIIDRDFDDQKTILVSGTIRVDIDGDKRVDEPLKNTQLLLCIAGEVCDLDNNEATTYTDENGTYQFDGLKPGNFVIMEVDKPGYESLSDVDGGDKNIISLKLDGTKDVTDQDFEDLAVAPMFILINKTTSKKEVSIGDFVPYSVTVENQNESFNYAAVKLKDTLPAGFKYVKNSARIIRDNKKSKIKSDGNSIVRFGEFALKAKEKVTLTYLLKVGVGVAKGEHTNRAIAIQNDKEVSNTSTATVKVIADPFIDNSVVIGKVFDDQNENGIQDNGERGIPGVRLATVEGMLIETDGYGRYHIADTNSGGFGGRGSNFIIKVDDTTLPKGAIFTTENPRVYRITSGELNTIDFGVKLPKQKRISTKKLVKKRIKITRAVEIKKDIQIGSVFFDSDQDCIRPDQVETIDKIVQKIQEYGHGSIMIEGNTDARAPMWYNKKLAYKRAKSVYDELKHRLGDSLMDSVEVIYNNCKKEVKFDPKYDWWGKPNAPKTKKECTQFGISKGCNKVLKNNKGGAL
jgi:uncharacterized repeat protein (TIGR01451 family)